MTSKTAARIAALIRTHGRTAEHEVTGWGFTQAEINDAVKAGAVGRIGSLMGATTIRYLVAT